MCEFFGCDYCVLLTINMFIVSINIHILSHKDVPVLRSSIINLLTPNDQYMGRTAPLTSKGCIFIYLFNKYRY